MSGSIKFSPGDRDGYSLSQDMVALARKSGTVFPKRVSIYGTSNDWFVVCYTTKAMREALLDAAKKMNVTVLHN